MGRPFITASTSHIRVSNPSSFRTCSLRRAFRILRVVLIHRSQIPPWCDAAGGLKIQRTNCCNKYSRIRCLFHFWIQVRNSFSPADEIGPTISPHQHRLASSRNETAKSVCKGICIKRVRDFDVDGSDRQTRENRAIPLHLTSSLLHHKWAKEVDPSMTERRLSAGGTRSSERSAIFWLHTGASRRLQLIQLARKLHTTELARIIQNFVRRSDRTYSFPEWPDAKWCTICSEKRSINSHS